LTAGRSREIQAAFVAREREPSTLMITPGVLEVIAAKK
jgi:hypothetical protein